MINPLNLAGKKGLIAGVANEHSIAFGCAKAMHSMGAELLLTYGDVRAEPYVLSATQSLEGAATMLCDVRDESQLDAVFERIEREWGRLDFFVHCITISPGPLKTRAASGIAFFDELLEKAAAEAPRKQLVTIEDVGAVASCLVSDAAAGLTGHTAYVDAGLHIRA